MVEFLNDRVPTGVNSISPLSVLSSANSDVPSAFNFPSSFGGLQAAPVEMSTVSLANHNLLSPRPSMSLAQLSWEYAAYVLLNQAGLDDHNAIMAATSALPQSPTQSTPQLGSLTSLLPYANVLSLLNTNLAFLRQISALQNATANSTTQTVESTGFPISSSAATCGSSVGPTAPSPQPILFENSGGPPAVEPAIQSASPQSVSPINLDESMHNSVSKNKLGRSFYPGRPLAMADRQRILDLYKQGHKISHIARIIGVTHSCVSKLMTRYRRTGSMHPRSAQAPRKSSSGIISSCSPRSSTSPFSSIFEVSSSFHGSSLGVTDEPPTAQPTSLQSAIFGSFFLNAPSMSTEEPADVQSAFIHKPIPLPVQNNSVYCVSS